MKLKKKVDRITYINKKKPMFIYHVQGVVRFGDQLDSGLFEITINKHYSKENQIENI